MSMKQMEKTIIQDMLERTQVDGVEELKMSDLERFADQMESDSQTEDFSKIKQKLMERMQIDNESALRLKGFEGGVFSKIAEEAGSEKEKAGYYATLSGSKKRKADFFGRKKRAGKRKLAMLSEREKQMEEKKLSIRRQYRQECADNMAGNKWKAFNIANETLFKKDNPGKEMSRDPFELAISAGEYVNRTATVRQVSEVYCSRLKQLNAIMLVNINMGEILTPVMGDMKESEETIRSKTDGLQKLLYDNSPDGATVYSADEKLKGFAVSQKIISDACADIGNFMVVYPALCTGKPMPADMLAGFAIVKATADKCSSALRMCNMVKYKCEKGENRPLLDSEELKTLKMHYDFLAVCNTYMNHLLELSKEFGKVREGGTADPNYELSGVQKFFSLKELLEADNIDMKKLVLSDRLKAKAAE